jgi:serine protease Do
VQRAWLGVGVQELDDKLARKFHVENHKGVLVGEIFPNSPAAAAGLQTADVVVSFAGQPVSSHRQLQENVERATIGSTQRVEILRNGKPLTLSVVVKALPAEVRPAAARPQPRSREDEDYRAFQAGNIGLQVTELTEDLSQRLGFKGLSGVVISDVTPGGLAAAEGLQEGMLILRVADKPVKSVAEFRAALKGESLKDGIFLQVRTRSGNRFVVLQQP